MWKDLGKDTKLNETQKFKIFGKACLRTCLFLVGKQKQGREQREFASLDEIRLECIKEMATISTPASHSVETHEAKSTSSMVQLHEARNAMYVASHKRLRSRLATTTPTRILKTGSGSASRLVQTIWGSCIKIC